MVFTGDLSHVAPQQPLLRLQSVVKILAGAWAQALADASWQLNRSEREIAHVGAPTEHQHPQSASYHPAMVLYSVAVEMHEVRGVVSPLVKGG